MNVALEAFLGVLGNRKIMSFISGVHNFENEGDRGRKVIWGSGNIGN